MGIGASLARWLRHSRSGRAVGTRLGSGYIRLCLHTIRWKVEGREAFDAEIAKDTVIAAIWHGRLFFSPVWAPKSRETVAMISNNRDGDLISGIVARFGVGSVRGSTYDRAKGRDKGGGAAYQAAEAALRRGAVVAITPDGPRGPRMRAQAGAAQLAIATGLPVVPMAFSTRRGRFTRSWDRFLFAVPFDRGALIYGAPMTPPAAPDAGAQERFRREIEAALTEVTNRADELCGRTPVPPAPSEP